jgi:hypothetical protein
MKKIVRFLRPAEQEMLDEDPQKWPIIRDEILVIATMHLHRHPDYWIDR